MPAACCVVRFHTCAVPTTATSDSNIIIKSSRQVETFSDFYSKKKERKNLRQRRRRRLKSIINAFLLNICVVVVFVGGGEEKGQQLSEMYGIELSRQSR